MDKFENSLSDFANSRYDLTARDSDAPGVTHCVSAVRYIIAETTGWTLPWHYIGDLCRGILDDRSIPASLVSLDEGDIGDLIFFYGKSINHRAYMIKHVGILVNPDRFFHSARRRGGTFDSIEERINTGSIATCKILTQFTDPRRKIL